MGNIGKRNPFSDFISILIRRFYSLLLIIYASFTHSFSVIFPTFVALSPQDNCFLPTRDTVLMFLFVFLSLLKVQPALIDMEVPTTPNTVFKATIKVPYDKSLKQVP